jgi:hypothetical protein
VGRTAYVRTVDSASLDLGCFVRISSWHHSYAVVNSESPSILGCGIYTGLGRGELDFRTPGGDALLFVIIGDSVVNV